jgi:hypothetical protein
MNPTKAAKDPSVRCIARAQIPKIVLVPAGFFDLFRNKSAAGVSMNQNTGQHPSCKEIAAGLGPEPESGPPNGTNSVENL